MFTVICNQKALLDRLYKLMMSLGLGYVSQVNEASIWKLPPITHSFAGLCLFSWKYVYGSNSIPFSCNLFCFAEELYCLVNFAEFSSLLHGIFIEQFHPGALCYLFRTIIVKNASSSLYLRF